MAADATADASPTERAGSDEPGGAGAPPWPSPRVAWYAVFVFFLAVIVNFLDRQIVALLVEPIKADLGLSDTQIGLVMGFAYIVFYVILGLPIARLADHASRKTILGAGLAVWGLATAACGLARNFTSLFAFRVGVGVGEACSGPPVYSMLSDLFPRAKLARAISIMNFGYAGGIGAALLFGGTVVAFLSSSPEVTIPVLGAFRAWQVVFFLVGIPGLVVAALVATLPEPVRRGRLTSMGADGKLKAPPLKEVRDFIWSERAAYAPMFLGLGIKTVLTVGASQWLVTFFIRTYGMSVPEITLPYGLMWVTLGPLGSIAGGLMSERFLKAGHSDANMRVVFLSAVVVTPIAIALPLMPNATLAFVVLAAQVFVGGWVFGPQNAALQVITPNQMRGQITALFFFVFNVIGFGLGPLFVALMTDNLYGDAGLRYSLCTAAAILGPTAMAVIWFGLKPYAAAVERADRWQ